MLLTIKMEQLQMKVLVIFSLVVTARAIRCYQCISTGHDDPFQCKEYMDGDVDIEPTSCDTVFDAQYCVKHTGRFEGGLGTRRFCSSLDLGNYCNYVQQPGDTLEYRSCVYTCSTDGCNHGSKEVVQTVAMVALLGVLYRLR